MIGEDQTNIAPFTYEVDETIQNRILNLDQKLKGLLSEIETKKKSAPPQYDALITEQQAQLIRFSVEIKKALASMGTVVEIITNETEL